MMDTSRFTTRFGVLLTLLAVGCAGVQPTPKAPPVDTAPYLQKARAAEEQDDIQKALAYLELAEAISPGDPQIAAQRTKVATTARKRAAQHFQRGEAHFAKGKHRAAQREFMAVLRYEPDHAGALGYLKDKFSPASSTPYRVVPGDSLKEIADKVYLDPSKAFLIAYFNDLPPTAVPQPGTTLLIPRLKGMAVAVTRQESAGKALEAPPEKGKVKPPPPAGGPETPALTETTEDSGDAVMAGYGEAGMDEMVLTIYEEQEDEILQALRQAKSLMGKRDYDNVIPLARLILEKDPANEEAADLVNAAFYQKGAEMDRQRKFLESLEMYEEVEPGYRDVDTRIVGVRQSMKAQAEQLYRQGVNYYVNENLAGAIDSWEKTLALDPEHAKAGQDIEKARLLLKKLQAIQ